MHKKMRWIVPLCICVGAVLLIAVTLIKFMPMFSAMFATDISADPEILLSDFICIPAPAPDHLYFMEYGHPVQ